jgi:Protein tyrosine/serine phosphatase
MPFFFQTLANPANAPLLFNCSAGKDRTGIAAALVLSTLGVDRETVFTDYLLSEVHLKEKYKSQIEEDPASEPFFTVQRNFLEAAFDEIDTRYGGMESYLRKQLKVDTELLRELYTVPE